ncbi:hypothetical protein ABWK22_01865 [Gottfriedia acidiceleris]|uniref:hypothetical protein n=1 Tax=Gottfriedia acidiceleris TaxID=371036 RepID=UPI003396B2DB
MIHFSTINEGNLTAFHRNHFIISITDLKDTSIFKDHDLNNENHISIETSRRLFPKATNITIANLVLTMLQMQIEAGKTHFLFVFNDDNKEESFDMVNGLVLIWELMPSSDEQQQYFDYLRTFAQEWTHLIVAEDKRKKEIGTQKEH